MFQSHPPDQQCSTFPRSIVTHLTCVKAESGGVGRIHSQTPGTTQGPTQLSSQCEIDLQCFKVSLFQSHPTDQQCSDFHLFQSHPPLTCVKAETGCVGRIFSQPPGTQHSSLTNLKTSPQRFRLTRDGGPHGRKSERPHHIGGPWERACKLLATISAADSIILRQYRQSRVPFLDDQNPI